MTVRGRITVSQVREDGFRSHVSVQSPCFVCSMVCVTLFSLAKIRMHEKQHLSSMRGNNHRIAKIPQHRICASDLSTQCRTRMFHTATNTGQSTHQHGWDFSRNKPSGRKITPENLWAYFGALVHDSTPYFNNKSSKTDSRTSPSHGYIRSYSARHLPRAIVP